MVDPVHLAKMSPGFSPSITIGLLLLQRFKKDERIPRAFSRYWKVREIDFVYRGSEHWKLCADRGALTRYLYQTETGGLICTPSRFGNPGIRPARGVAGLTGLPVSRALVLDNTLACFSVALFLLFSGVHRLGLVNLDRNRFLPIAFFVVVLVAAGVIGFRRGSYVPGFRFPRGYPAPSHLCPPGKEKVKGQKRLESVDRAC